MSWAIDMIRESSALLNTEIVTLVRSGQMMNTEDSVFGYVIEPENDSMLEVKVRSLAIVNDELYAFMSETEDIDYSEEAHLQSSVFKLSKDLIDSIHEEGIVAYTS